MIILAGIMYCIENEYDDAIWSLGRQSFKDTDYFSVENLPNKEAHDTLYSHFMANADKYDLFLKLDADMVLCRTDFLSNVAQVMQKNSQIDDLEIGVHDFFTDRLIYGLHIYRNTVQWYISDETIFVDTGARIRQKVQDMKVLAPAAWHCPNPSPFQAFHFGIHKAIKVCQTDIAEVRAAFRQSHIGNIRRLYAQYLLRRDRRLGLAVAGAFYGLINRCGSSYADFNNADLLNAYESFQVLAAEDLWQEIQKMITQLQNNPYF